MPSLSNIKDLNAYITLWLEDKETSLDECTERCQDAEEICKQIVEQLYEAKCNGDSERALRCIEYLKTLRLLTREKLGEVTQHVLENVEKELERSEEDKAALAAKSNPCPKP